MTTASDSTAPASVLSTQHSALSTRRLVLVRRFARNRAAVLGMVLLGLLVLMSAFAPLVARQSPEQIDLGQAQQPPGVEHWFGTDQLGRDLWSRVVYGGRVSLLMSVAAVLLSVLIGIPLGALAGYLGGLIDTALMRLMDIMLSFPGILLALAISVALGRGLRPAIIAAAVVSIPIYVRLTRAAVLGIKNLPFVESAVTIGASRTRTLVRHILPNTLTPLIVQSSLQLASVLLLIASLGFLGLGVSPPTPEWGTLVADGRPYLRTASHITTLPGVVLILAVLAFNLIGDGLRDALDVKAAR
jgi:peptide/nickel transport system permease protein